jgi:peroxiredoxin
VITVRDHLDQFADANIAVVTFAAPERLAAYREHLRLPFDVVADTDRTLYRLLGAERGTTRQVWSIGTIRMYARLIRAGRRLHRPTEDTHQLGADAVVGRDATLRSLSLPSTPDARPPISDLFAALD